MLFSPGGILLGPADQGLAFCATVTPGQEGSVSGEGSEIIPKPCDCCASFSFNCYSNKSSPPWKAASRIGKRSPETL